MVSAKSLFIILSSIIMNLFAPAVYAETNDPKQNTTEKNFALPGYSAEEAFKEIPLPPELITPPAKEAEQSDRFFQEFLNMLFTLGVIIFFLLLLSWLVKRMTRTRMQQVNESSAIKISDSRSLSSKTAVYLLEIRGKTIAVAESSNGLTLLGEIKE